MPISRAPASCTRTASPASNSPATSTIPTGSRLVPPSRSARAAPASTVTTPCAGFAYFSQSLKLEWRTACGANRVPIRSPAQARVSVPGSNPLAITVGMPAAVAISAATTLERIPPEPSGDISCPMSSASSSAGSRTSSTSRAPGSRRGLAV